MALTHLQVIQMRNDLSPFLFHLTRSGRVKIRKDIFPHLTQDQDENYTAKQRLDLILQTKRIKALSSFGYFHYKVPYVNQYGRRTSNPSSNVDRRWLKAVCFTETPLDYIYIQTQPIVGRTLHFEPYGLAFNESFISSNSGSPVMYFESGNQTIKTALDDMATSQDAHKFKTLMPLVEGFGPRIYGTGPDVNFRWEREWRCPDDLTFTFQDVAFGVCKSADIAYFSGLVGNAFPFIDPVGNSQHLQTVKTYLRGYSHLSNLK